MCLRSIIENLAWFRVISAHISYVRIDYDSPFLLETDTTAETQVFVQNV